MSHVADIVTHFEGGGACNQLKLVPQWSDAPG